MDCNKEIKNISDWMREYCEKSGKNGFVVGVSGGVDSAVVATLACRAVGKENVSLILLPCFSSQDSVSDALELSCGLGVVPETINFENSYYSVIGDIMCQKEKYSHKEDSNKNLESEFNRVSIGNIKARLRMLLLYCLAEKHNYLVAGTGNLSEIMIGYLTKYGDGGVDIEPLGEYFKTEVFEIAKNMKEIPLSIIDKKPSADLYEGQTDEEEIGMTYYRLDNILKKIEEENEPFSMLNNDEKILYRDITKVKKMISLSQHKRLIPPTFKRN